jgi:hypothetical protein
MIETSDLQGRKVLLPRADIGRDLVADELRKQGADVSEVVAYRTVIVESEREGEPDIYRMLLERRIDVVTFTSPSAVRNFVRVLGAEPAADLLRTTVVAAIGPVTAEAAAQCNIPTTIVPASYTVPSLIDANRETFFHRFHHLRGHAFHPHADIVEADAPAAAAAALAVDARAGARDAALARHVRAAVVRLRGRVCPPRSALDAWRLQPVGR